VRSRVVFSIQIRIRIRIRIRIAAPCMLVSFSHPAFINIFRTVQARISVVVAIRAFVIKISCLQSFFTNQMIKVCPASVTNIALTRRRMTNLANFKMLFGFHVSMCQYLKSQKKIIFSISNMKENLR